MREDGGLGTHLKRKRVPKRNSVSNRKTASARHPLGKQIRQNNEGPLRILVADDQEDVRHGICSLIEEAPDLEVCAEAVNGEEAVEKTIQLQPDLVILDISMPVMNGLDAARAIRACSPNTPILIVSIHEIQTMIDKAREIGVQGYVAKGQVSNLLIDAIHKVMRHQKFFPEASNQQHMN